MRETDMNNPKVNYMTCDLCHEKLHPLDAHMGKINGELITAHIDCLNKEKQEFQLGDIAYMIDEDYRFFESEVYRIELRNGKYYYDTHDCDFEFKDIGEWVFKTELYRELHLEAMV